MANGISTGGNYPTNKYGQPHYPDCAAANNALNNGGVTYGSSIAGADGNNYFVDGIGYTNKGAAYVTAHKESEFDWMYDLQGGGGSASEREQAIGDLLEPAHDFKDTMRGIYYLKKVVQ